MRSIGIATYTIRIRAKRAQDCEFLGEIGGGPSLAGLLNDYLASISGDRAVDVQEQVVLQAAQYERQDDLLRGLLNSGDFGYAADGFNIPKRAASYRRTPDDAETIPFYFRAFLPGDNRVGVLLVQRFGGFGVITALIKGFRAYLDEVVPDYLLLLARLVPATVVRQLAEGQVRSIQVVAHTIPDDIADKLRYLGYKQDVGTFIIETRARRNRFLRLPPWLRRIREGRAHLVELPAELRDVAARIKIGVSYGGTTRTIDLSDPSSLAPYIDATEDLKLDKSGHPSFESIDGYCAELLQELLEQLGRE